MIKKSFGIVFLASMLGVALMWAVYLLPTDVMAEHVIESQSVLQKQDDTEALFDEAYWKVYDRNTNIIMLYEVIFPGTGNAFIDALEVPSYNYIDDWMQDWSKCITEYASDRVIEKNTLSYARYWHGYLVFLKPLFLFFNLEQIYVLSSVFMIFLFMVNLYLFYKKLGFYSLAYVAAVCMMNPMRMFVSFQLLSVFFVMQATLFLLFVLSKREDDECIYVFLLDGILIAFFDFLTYPLVACVIPLLTYYLLHRESLMKSVIKAIKQSFFFFFGYAGMWFMKWIIATVFTSDNIIVDALGSVFHRVGMSDGFSSENEYIDAGVSIALQRNLVSFFNNENLILIVVFAIVLLLLFVLHRKQMHLDKECMLVCGLISILPFIWVSILSNHASLHPHLEWRNFVILIYAVVVFFISFFQREKGDS